jgi:hypothetical protein
VQVHEVTHERIDTGRTKARFSQPVSAIPQGESTMSAIILTFDRTRRRHQRDNLLERTTGPGVIVPFLGVRYEHHDRLVTVGGTDPSLDPLDGGGSTCRRM